VTIDRKDFHSQVAQSNIVPETQRGDELIKLRNGEQVTLRTPRREDLQELVSFFNDLVNEKLTDQDSELHSGFDRRVSLEEESQWLDELLGSVKKGDVISIVAMVDGKIVANGGVTRGKYSDTNHHGELGLTVTRAYRGKGIGRIMIERLIAECQNMGVKTLEVEFLSTNQAAKAAYQKAGFLETGKILGKVLRKGKYVDASIMSRHLVSWT
jgi:RimJ/RimL family protein N-acetyltransferase